MKGEIHALTAECHAFDLQAKTLFCAGGERKLDLAARAHDAEPGQTVGRIGMQQASDGAVI